MKKLLVFSVGFLSVILIILAVQQRLSTTAPMALPVILGESTSNPIATPTIATFGAPIIVTIPSIGVDTAVESVGEDPDGRMSVPKEWNNVGWYNRGTQPGELGSAVIAGHVDSPTGPAIFYEANTLQNGDEIIVKNESGEQLIFEVVDKKIYPDATFPIQEVFAKKDMKRLNLITCTGTFDKSTKQYSDRLVVYAVLRE